MDAAVFVDNALNASDLMQGFVDICADNLSELSEDDRAAVKEALNDVAPSGAEEAAAIAVLDHLLTEVNDG
jgi:hypothetical protein